MMETVKITIKEFFPADETEYAEDAYIHYACHDCNYVGYTDVSLTQRTIVGNCENCDEPFEEPLTRAR